MKDQKFPGQIGETYHGKVRKVTQVGGVLVAETTNNISAFDVILPGQIPMKGAVLNLIAAYFMRETEDIIPNCLLDVPHPRVSIWRKLIPFKIEVVVRGYNTGSFYRNYSSKEHVQDPWGYHNAIQFHKLNKNQKLPVPFVTPTSKEDAPGKHDEDISFEKIVSSGLATEEEWKYIKEKAEMLFERGQYMASERGLILVDTKYEFGKDSDGKIYLIDEIHTPDSSRYWYADSYKEAFLKGEEPKALSKEFVRQWLVEHNFQGRKDDVVPIFPSDFVQSITDRYLELYNVVTSSEMKMTEEEDLYEKVCASLIRIRPQVEGALVGVIMGSNSDLPVLESAIKILTDAGVTVSVGAVSAHRTPRDVEQYAKTAKEKGMKVIIAAAGGAAHLPGMIAASTILPVIGVPIKSAKSMIGLDSLLSIVQMPAGVPVATMAIDGAENAGLYALQILGIQNEMISNYLETHKKQLINKVLEMRSVTSEKYFFE